MNSTTTRQFGITLSSGDASINSIVTEDGNTFFNATELWKLAGSDVSKKPNKFLRSEDAQKHIHYRWEKLNKNNDFQSRPHSAFNYEAHKTLPAEVEAPFIFVTKGRYGSTWMDYNVFVDYAQYISVEFKNVLIETFKSYGFVYAAPVNKQAEILLEVARQKIIEVEAQANEVNFDSLSRKDRIKIFAKASARLKQMETTGQFKALIAELHGASNQADVVSIYRKVFGTINKNLFGHESKVLANGLGGSYSREWLSSSSLRAVNAIELELCQHIEDSMEDGEWIGIDELASLAGKLSKKARKDILFRNGKTTRVIAERTKTKNTTVQGELSSRGDYTVELESDLKIYGTFEELPKDKK